MVFKGMILNEITYEVNVDSLIEPCILPRIKTGEIKRNQEKRLRSRKEEGSQQICWAGRQVEK